MSNTSKTGLVPAQKKNFRLVKRCKPSDDNRMPARFEALPMALSLRPFGGLFNPFAKGCSVLCNHPAPTGVKDMIHQMKSSLATDLKGSPQCVKDQLVPVELLHHNGPDNIPEDLFRRYTDTDSRPLTPTTPTVTSVRTRTSAAGSFLNNRRCITPELGKNEIIKRKKIILDLRRSHSQETLYWKPSSEMSQSALEANEKKPKSAGANEEKKPKRQKSDEQRPRSSLGGAAIGEDDSGVVKKAPQTCINDQTLDDEDIRRGKKRKKAKTTAPATTTFHLSEDPETQVAALGPDSLNPSTRPSLIPNSVSLLQNKDKRESEPVLLKGSFLTDDAFQVLKTELDVDVIENTFDRYLNRALREAIKYVPQKPKSLNKITEEIEKLTIMIQPKMPRKFSKSATRFDVPMNLNALTTMTVLEYLSKYVWVSNQRKQLYKRVFLKYLTNIVEDSEAATEQLAEIANQEEDVPTPCVEYSYVERKMNMQHLAQALEDVLEFHGTESNIAVMLRLLDYDKLEDVTELDFRTWCGIVSFAERLALEDPTGTDSCDELEKADFGSLEQRLAYLTISENLRQVFTIIRNTHNVAC